MFIDNLSDILNSVRYVAKTRPFIPVNIAEYAVRSSRQFAAEFRWLDEADKALVATCERVVMSYGALALDVEEIVL